MAEQERPKRTPLFVRLPTEEAERLDDAARGLRMTKGLIVAQAISNYLNTLEQPPTPELLDAAAKFVNSREPGTVAEGGVRPMLRIPGPMVLASDPGIGHHSFTPVEQLDVLTLEQLSTLLDVDVEAARELAERDELPGRKIGGVWRFSRAAVMAWLAGE